jgi:hypothetical protein
MHTQCQFFQASVYVPSLLRFRSGLCAQRSELFIHACPGRQYNPKDDASYAAWGSMLMHLSMVSEEQVPLSRFTKCSVTSGGGVTVSIRGRTGSRST